MNKEREKNIDQIELDFPHPGNFMAINGAVGLVNHFNQEGLMLPVTMGHYKKLAYHGTLVVAKNNQAEVVGTAAFTQFYKKHIWEFGGWAVAEDYQHKGIGLQLITALFKKHHHFQTIAFGNKNSGPILESLGAKVIHNHAILPKKAFDLCANCPRKPKVGCCDTIYNMSPVVEALGMPDTSWMSFRQVERLVYGIGEGQSGDFQGLGKKPEEWY